MANDLKFQGHILVAEDNLSNQMLAKVLLTKLGFEVTLVENGKDAIEVLDSKPFKAILMDMMMPVMNGYEAAAELKQRGSKIPIIAITANAMKGDREKCLEAGCDEYATKPITKDKLGEVLKMFIEPINNTENAENVQNTTNCNDNSPIISELANDPDLSVVADMFVERLSEAVNQIKSAFEDSQIDTLKSLVHEVKGAGGSAGYPILTEKARFLEGLIKENKIDNLKDTIDDFIGLCNRVQAPTFVKSNS